MEGETVTGRNENNIMTPLQQAILTLAEHIQISLIVSNEDTTQIAFSGSMEIDANEIAQLIKRGIITLGYKTGRVKVIAQPPYQVGNE